MGGMAQQPAPTTQQQQVDPQVMEITQMISASIEQGQNPMQVVKGLIQQEVDQQLIAQALIVGGMEEQDIISLFEQIQKDSQPSPPQDVTQNPELLARNESIQKQEEQSAESNPMAMAMDMAKSGIEIKPENKGKFTRWAKARGMSVQEAARKVMANPDEYPPAVVKMANFAKNAAGWKKEYGGEKGEEAYLENRDAVIKEAIAKAQDGDEVKNPSAIDNYLMRGTSWQNQNLVAPDLTPPPTVNVLLDGLTTGMGVYNELLSGEEDELGLKKGAFRDFKDKKDLHKITKPLYYDYSYVPNNSEENIEAKDNFLSAFLEEQKDLSDKQKTLSNAEYQTKIDDIMQNKIQDKNKSFKDWLNEQPDNIKNATGQALETAKSIFKALGNKDDLPEEQFGGASGSGMFNAFTQTPSFATPGIIPNDLFTGQTSYINPMSGQPWGYSPTSKSGVVSPEEIEQSKQAASEGESTMDLFNKIDLGDVKVDNPVEGFLDRVSDNPVFKGFTSGSKAAVDVAGFLNRIYDQKNYKENLDQAEFLSQAEFQYNAKTFDPLSRGTYNVQTGQLMGESERVPGYYMNFPSTPYSAPTSVSTGYAKKGGEFKPHLMFDPETKKAYKANVPEDHERMAEMGYLHKDEMQDGGEVIELSQDMIAQLIAAGADIEIL